MQKRKYGRSSAATHAERDDLWYEKESSDRLSVDGKRSKCTKTLYNGIVNSDSISATAGAAAGASSASSSSSSHLPAPSPIHSTRRSAAPNSTSSSTKRCRYLQAPPSVSSSSRKTPVYTSFSSSPSSSRAVAEALENLGTRQTGRSNFELSESGAVDLLVDTLQFHLDGLYAASASCFARRRSVAKIVETVALIPSTSLRASGLVSKLSKLLILLQTESDELTQLGLLNLGFLLCLDDTGAFRVPIGFNADMLASIFSLIVREDSRNIQIIDDLNSRSSPVKGKEIISVLNSINPTAEMDSGASVETNSSRFHKKRVFKTKLHPANVRRNDRSKTYSGNDPNDTERVCHEDPCGHTFDQNVQQKGNIMMKPVSPDSDSIMQAQEYAKTVSSLSPEVCKTLVGSVYMDIFSSQILALLLVNRLLKSLVQAYTRTTTISMVKNQMKESTSNVDDIQTRCANFQAACMKDQLLYKMLSYFGKTLQKMSSQRSHTSNEIDVDDVMIVQRILKRIDEIVVKENTTGGTIDWMVAPIDASNDSNSSLTAWSELWLQIGIIDGLCFRFPKNQVALSQAVVTIDDDRLVLLPVSLLHVLTSLRKSWLHCMENNITDLSLPPLQDRSPAKTTHSSGSVISINYGNDKQYKDPSDTADENDDYHQATNGIGNEDTETEVDGGTNRKTMLSCRHRRFVLDTDTGKIGCAEVFIDTLKCLINLSHRCDESCRSILESGGIQTLTSYLDILYSIRHRINDRRIMEIKSHSICSPIKYEEKKIPLDASLTPKETNVERIVFDSTLCVITLLTNIMEYQQTRDKSHANDLLNCAIAHTTFEASTLIKVTNKSNLLKSRTNDMLKLLVFILLRESSVFMKTLDETNDSMVNASTPTDEPTDMSLIVTIESESTHMGGIEHKPESQKDDVSKDDSIPVSEIIMSAHVCLLIHAILYIQPNSSDVIDDSDTEMQSNQVKNNPLVQGKDTTMQEEAKKQYDIRRNGTYSSMKDEIIRYLPKKNLWLPIRILKAFLYLEEKTGCLLFENMSPVLDVIHVMSRVEKEA